MGRSTYFSHLCIAFRPVLKHFDVDIKLMVMQYKFAGIHSIFTDEINSFALLLSCALSRREKRSQFTDKLNRGEELTQDLNEGGRTVEGFFAMHVI